MISQDEKIAQNELSADLITQALHKKRLYLLIITILLYKASGSFYVFIFYMFALLTLMRLSPIRFYEKENSVHIILIHKIDNITKLAKKKIFFLLSKIFVISFVSITHAAQQEDIPPPPPPPPPSEMVKEVQPEAIKPSVLQKLVQSQMIRNIIMRTEKVAFGGHREYYIKKVNHFNFHPSLPLLFEFDKNIKDIYIQTLTAKIIFEDNYLFMLPNDLTDSKLIGFVVAFEDGGLAYFAGERVDDTDGIKDLVKYADDLHKSLSEGKDDKAKERTKKVILYYTYKTPRTVPVEDIVAGYLAKVQRCPIHNENFIFQGKLYRFIRKDDKFLRDDNEIYACNAVYAIEPVQ